MSSRPASAVSSRRLKPVQEQIVRNGRPISAKKNTNEELQKAWLSKKGLDESTARLIWDAFGQYLAKCLKQRRGVIVPKFGLFTFSSHDQMPVFVISKDFGAGSFVRPAISNAVSQLRPFEAAVADGRVPQTKVNYLEVATFTNGKAGKDACKTQCETMFNHGAEKIRAGSQITELIPHVGRLTVKNGLAGVIFDSSLLSTNAQLTTKQNLMAEKPPLPLKVNKPLTKLDIDQVQEAKSQKGNETSQRLFAARNMSGKENNSRQQNQSHRSISFQKALDQMGDSSIRRLVQQNRGGSSRPMSAYENSQILKAHRSNRSSAALSSVGSRSSFVSTMSKLPDIPPFQLMHMANEIYSRGVMIIQMVQNKSAGVQSLRDVISSSQISKILSKTGLRFPIGNLKALLKELGFNWNGPSCSISQLLMRLKQYLNPQQSLNKFSSEITFNDEDNQSLSQKTAVLGQPLKPRSDMKTLLKLKHDKGAHTELDIIKEVFYATGKRLYQIFREKVTGNRMDFQAFFELVCKYSQYQINASDCKKAFDYVCEQTISPEHQTKDWLCFNDFQEYFQLTIPDPQKFQDENKVILIIKDWMAEYGYSSAQAFEILLTSVNRQQQKSFRRYDFQKAIASNAIKITAPEVDHFFDLLTQFKKLPTTLLGERQWKAKIIDEGEGSLQSLRKLVRERGLGQEQLLKIMQLRMWDYGLDYPNFMRALLKVEPSLTDHLCINFFERLQGNNNLVEVPILINNLCGTDHDTVDYKIKMIKELYQNVFGKGRQDEFIKLCEIEDKRNEGKLEPHGLEKVIKKVTGSQYSDEVIKKFVRQLHTDPCNGRISYLQFVDTAIGFGNKNHNPFKQLVMKIELYMTQRNQDAAAFLKGIGPEHSESVQIDTFVKFIKNKIDPSRQVEQIKQIANLMDVDKDGFICSNDLATCIKHLDQEVFYKDGGKALMKPQFNAKEKFFCIDAQDQISDNKIIEVCQQIRKAMEQKEYTPEDLFNGFDADGDGMLTIAEFSRGIISIVPLSTRILQRLFSLMDQQQIGMVPFESFKNILEIKIPYQIPRKANKIEDDFSWQEDTIKGIRKFVRQQQMTSLDAFRLFDQDFDGQISKQDMSNSIQQYLEIPPEKITDQRLSRLFRLLSFYKTETLQPSDFDRLLVDINPFLTSSQGMVKADFKKALGGCLPTTSTRDWKLAAIQQLGMVLSQKYANLSASFKDASRNTQKINFSQFAAFIEKTNALEGFNLSRQMLLLLFAEMDPHKKTFLSERDWLQSLGTFTQDKMLIVEFKNYLQCQFSDVMSAYGYFQTFDEESPLITFEIFAKAVKSLIKNRKYSDQQLRTIYKSLLSDPSDPKGGFSQKSFCYEFEYIKFRGPQTIQTLPNPNGKGGYVTTIKSAVNPEWERDIINRLRATMSAAGKSIEKIFADMDEDGNGVVTQKEFRNGIRKLGIGLTSKQIDQIMVRIDENGDGVIDYQEFFAILGERQGLDHKLVERAKNKLADLKEKMSKYMTSHGDAYRTFDSSKVGKMQFSDFNLLMNEICKISNTPAPAYAVIKDLFDAIDIKKDGNIDLAEWNQTFNTISGGGAQSSMVSNPLSKWDNSKESMKVGEMIHKHRKALLTKFKDQSTGTAPDGKTQVVNFKQAKKALDDLLYAEFTSKNQPISDAKLKMVLQCSAIPDPNMQLKEPLYNFTQMFELFKQRYQPKV